MPLTSLQAVLRFVRDGNHRRGLSLPPLFEHCSDAGRVTVMPTRFDQQPPRVRIARRGDPAASDAIRARVLVGTNPT